MASAQPPRHFCTYFDAHYLPKGLALYGSLQAHSSQPFVLWILCLDAQTYDLLGRLDLPGVRLVRQQELEACFPALLAARGDRSRVEYYWTCTPFLPQYVLSLAPDADPVTYLDADLFFFDDPAAMLAELGEGAILLYEHRYSPQYQFLLDIAGRFNVGSLVFRRDARALAALSWWGERCLEWCYQRREAGKYGDQRYLDDWPERFAGVVVSCHQGMDVGPWNVTGSRLASRGGRIFVDDVPLVFYHFHGFRQFNRWLCHPLSEEYPLSDDLFSSVYVPYIRASLKAIGQVRQLVPGFDAGFARSRVRDIVRSALKRRVFLTVSERWMF